MGKTGIGDQSVKAATAFADEDNNVVTVLGVSSVNGKGDNVVTVGGGTVTDKQSHCNTTSTSVASPRQADHIEVSKGLC